MNRLMSFFTVTQPGEVTWSHGTNSRAALDNACGDPEVMMIEGDISRTADGQILMAHPPRQESDLTFEAWVAGSVRAGKGVKLDFKIPSVVTPCLEILRGMGLGETPVLLNADILEGPGGGPSGFHPGDFIAQCARGYPAGVLSVGWTTGRTEGGRYTEAMVEGMLAACAAVEGGITFPVRAAFVRDSWEALLRLLERPGRSLSVWCGEPVEEDLKAWLREAVGLERAYFDLKDAKGLPIRFEGL